MYTLTSFLIGLFLVACEENDSQFDRDNDGFGGVEYIYSGWEVLEWTDFQNQWLAEAPSYFYNLNGLTNIAPGWTSSNCCITSPAANRKYVFSAQLFMYPSNNGVNDKCGGVYASRMYV